MDTITRIIPETLKVCPHLPGMEHAVVNGYMFTENEAYAYLISKAEINSYTSIIIDFTATIVEDGFAIASYNISSLIATRNVYVTVRLTPEQLTEYAMFSETMIDRNIFIQVVMANKFPKDCSGKLVPVQMYLTGDTEGEDLIIPLNNFMIPRYQVDPARHHISKWLAEQSAEAATKAAAAAAAMATNDEDDDADNCNDQDD